MQIDVKFDIYSATDAYRILTNVMLLRYGKVDFVKLECYLQEKNIRLYFKYLEQYKNSIDILKNISYYKKLVLKEKAPDAALWLLKAIFRNNMTMDEELVSLLTTKPASLVKYIKYISWYQKGYDTSKLEETINKKPTVAAATLAIFLNKRLPDHIEKAIVKKSPMYLINYLVHFGIRLDGDIKIYDKNPWGVHRITAKMKQRHEDLENLILSSSKYLIDPYIKCIKKFASDQDVAEFMLKV